MDRHKYNKLINNKTKKRKTKHKNTMEAGLSERLCLCTKNRTKHTYKKIYARNVFTKLNK